jgi:hypothetical protein
VTPNPKGANSGSLPAMNVAATAISPFLHVLPSLTQ